MKRFIFKIDDFRLNESLGKFDRLIQLCQRQSVPMSIGVIGAALRGGRFQLQQLFSEHCRSGAIELWNHSYNHKDMTQLSDIEVAWEIAATTTASERQLGHRPVGFGAPFNKCDERVARIATQQGMEFTYETAFAGAQLLTPEYNVPFDGQPNLEEFVKRVERKKYPDTLIVQVHPSRWLSRGFEQMESCLAWLREVGYEPMTVRQALGLSENGAQPRAAVGAHALMVEGLGKFWGERAAAYEPELSNFSSYFLGRFRANSLGIRRLLEELDADLASRVVVDVGCGLAQWGLPFFEFNRDATVWAFDTHKTLTRALQDARTEGLIPCDLRIHCEDFTTSSQLPAKGVERVACANALNYIPLLPFAQQCQRICKEAAHLILLNQTGDFNHLGVLDALHASNASMAKERGLCALRQDLVRRGFTGFMPNRTTPTARELEAVMFAFGFQLGDDFSPAWERTYRGRATFEGLVFMRHSWLDSQALPADFRPEYRKLLCQAGFPELDDELFANQTGDLKVPELALLKARAGLSVDATSDTSLTSELELGHLLRERAFARVHQHVAASRTEQPDWLLAGAVAALIQNDGAGARQLAQRLPQGAIGAELAPLLEAMMCVADGDMAAALSAVDA